MAVRPKLKLALYLACGPIWPVALSALSGQWPIWPVALSGLWLYLPYLACGSICSIWPVALSFACCV